MKKKEITWAKPGITSRTQARKFICKNLKTAESMLEIDKGEHPENDKKLRFCLSLMDSVYLKNKSYKFYDCFQNQNHLIVFVEQLKNHFSESLLDSIREEDI